MGELDRIEPKVAHTLLGEVQYADFGKGPVVVAIHGTPGGWDHAVDQGKFLARAGFRVIAPSRPGYPGTPLIDELKPMNAQADLIAALLDALDIDQAAIFSWSGGGPCGYRFARQHAERTSALIALAAVSQPYIWDQSPISQFFMNTRFGAWLGKQLANHAPEQTISGELASESDLSHEEIKSRAEAIMADPIKRAFALDLGRMATTSGNRKAGTDNDLAVFKDLEPLGLEQITVPTLIVQGTIDKDLDPKHSYYAASAIPNSQLLKINNAGHLGLFLEPGGDQAQQTIINFLKDHP